MTSPISSKPHSSDFIRRGLKHITNLLQSKTEENSESQDQEESNSDDDESSSSNSSEEDSEESSDPEDEDSVNQSDSTPLNELSHTNGVRTSPSSSKLRASTTASNNHQGQTFDFEDDSDDEDFYHYTQRVGRRPVNSPAPSTAKKSSSRKKKQRSTFRSASNIDEEEDFHTRKPTIPIPHNSYYIPPISSFSPNGRPSRDLVEARATNMREDEVLSIWEKKSPDSHGQVKSFREVFLRKAKYEYMHKLPKLRSLEGEDESSRDDGEISKKSSEKQNKRPFTESGLFRVVKVRKDPYEKYISAFKADDPIKVRCRICGEEFAGCDSILMGHSHYANYHKAQIDNEKRAIQNARRRDAHRGRKSDKVFTLPARESSSRDHNVEESSDQVSQNIYESSDQVSEDSEDQSADSEGEANKN